MMKICRKIQTTVKHPAVVWEKVKRSSRLVFYSVSREGYAHFPQTIYVSLNNVCNLQCVMCDVGQRNKESQFYQNMSGKEGELSIDVLRKLVGDVKKHKPDFHIVGTEPLLYKDLFVLGDLLVENGLKLGITTNGFLLERYAEAIVKAKVDNVHISLDGLADVHDAIRGVDGSFARAVNGIKLLIEWKRKWGSDIPKIHVNSAIIPLNAHGLVDFADRMNDAGIDSLTFNHMNFVTAETAEIHNLHYHDICKATPSSVAVIDPRKTNIDGLFAQLQQIESRIAAGGYQIPVNAIPQLKTKEDVYNYYNKPEIVVNRKKCLVPWESVQIQANGDVIVLTRCFDLVLGNINRESIGDIWNGEKYRNFRKALRKNGLFPACTRCCGIM